MQEPEMSTVVALIQQMAAREYDTIVESREVEDILRGVLWEPRNLLRATQSGLVTRTETAGALAAHVHRWLMDRTSRAWGKENPTSWDDFIRALETALFLSK